MPTSFAQEFPVSDVITLKPAINLTSRRFLAKIFTLEGLGGVGGNLLMYGIFFYMHNRFGWGAKRNLLLSSAEGLAYVVGALAANPLSHRFDPQKLLRILEIGMAALRWPARCLGTPQIIVVLLLAYTMVSAAQWPLMESLISVGATPAEIFPANLHLQPGLVRRRRVDLRRLRIRHRPLPAGNFPGRRRRSPGGLRLASADSSPTPPPPCPASPRSGTHPAANAGQIRLSRIALPATFAMIYALGAIMPTLPVIQSVHPELRTLLASVWMIARWFCFLSLGADRLVAHPALRASWPPPSSSWPRSLASPSSPPCSG